MALNSKKLESTSRFVYYTISGILCLFLILLSGKIIDDLDTTTTMPVETSYGDTAAVSKLRHKEWLARLENDELLNKQSVILRTAGTAKANYANEKQSFDNWVETRKTLGSPDKDEEVIARAKKLDGYYAIAREWQAQLTYLQNNADDIEKRTERIAKDISKEQVIALEEYQQAFKQYELRVFLIRLLFVMPILAIGIFFFVRFRKHKFWPLYFGFTLFSLYAFFFGLVPYLPSYGGYVRYAAGVLLSIAAGYYAIRLIRKYIEQKQEELKASSTDRARNVQTEVAEKALANHFCPSCGKDFIIKKWEFPLSKNIESEAYRLVTSFCRHCGLELFKDCETCGERNFAHLPYCASCGTNFNQQMPPATPSVPGGPGILTS